MKATRKAYSHTPTPEDIAVLAAQVEREPTDLVNKIMLANALEQTGAVTRAIALYQEVADQDRDGIYGSVARKALENITLSDSVAQSATNISTPTQEKIEASTSHAQQVPQKFNLAFSRLEQGWKNLNFRTKLALLLVVSTTIPVIVVTQGIVAVTKNSLFSRFKQALQREAANFKQDYVYWAVDEARSEAGTLAQFVQTTQIDLSNPRQIAQQRQILQNYISNFRVSDESDSSEKNIRILTDAQGRTVVQYIQTLADKYYNSPPDRPVLSPTYRPVSLPIGIYLGDIPIVKNALQTGKDLGGMELLKSDILKRLGQDKQANIGLASQSTQGLPTSAQPFPGGTYDIDGGRAALVAMAVQPIKIGNKLVGTAIVGTLENRDFLKPDSFRTRAGVPFTTIFAQDWRINSNVPSADGKTRNVGTIAPRLVAETVLNQGQEFVGKTTIAGVNYLGAYQPLYDHQQELNPAKARPVGMAFVGRPLSEVDSLLLQQQGIAYAICAGLSLLAVAIAFPVAGSFARPLKRLADFAQTVGAGQVGIRLKDVQRQDEIGVLATNLNAMTANIESTIATIKQQEALQRQEKERLQQGMINLLLETEAAKDGDLTVRAKVNQEETGAIADAFNAVISSLRGIVLQVQTAAHQVQASAVDSEASVEKLAHEAQAQAEVVAEALASSEAMEQSIGAIANSSQTAARIAHQALIAAQTGDRKMDETVGSMETIRTSVSETTRKAKRLAEYAQEISKIIGIISGISEKTNILAFNAAIEASRAGEHGQGFRLVANEVRRLAERVTDATKEIEQLVSTIQQGTSDVLKTMEISNTQVVTGSHLVAQTKQTLQELASVSQEIDQQLRSISASTVSQAENSKTVNQTMQAVAAIAQTTWAESASVLSALQELLAIAKELQNSVSRFRVEK